LAAGDPGTTCAILIVFTVGFRKKPPPSIETEKPRYPGAPAKAGAEAIMAATKACIFDFTSVLSIIFISFGRARAIRDRREELSSWHQSRSVERGLKSNKPQHKKRPAAQAAGKSHAKKNPQDSGGGMLRSASSEDEEYLVLLIVLTTG
jgi:hypothetical protein